MSGTPHFLNYANGFEKQTASFALVKPGLQSLSAQKKRLPDQAVSPMKTRFLFRFA